MKKFLIWTVSIVFLLFVVFFIIGYIEGSSPEGKERAKQRDAIAYCWTQQQRKSLEPSTARFVARTCEKMEEDYRQKWGRNP